jgi:hypothetical protein
MSIPVFALGANPHNSAPLFYGKLKSIQEGIKRLKIKKIGEHYFRMTLATFIHGPRPEYCEVEIQRSGLDPVELPGIRFQPSEQMTRSRLRAQTPQLHYLPRGEQEANLAV